MKAVISPLFYLPPIHCVAAYLQSELFEIEAFEHYQKGSFRNKCRIGTAQGELILSVPLMRGKHQSQDIQKVRISNEEHWGRQHLRSVKTAYSNAPYFEHYFYLFEPIWNRRNDFLWQLNIDMLAVVEQCLGQSFNYQFTKQYARHLASDTLDLRNVKRPFLKIIPYPQVNESAIPFQQDLSILDLIFHLGPEAAIYLKSLQIESTSHNS